MPRRRSLRTCPRCSKPAEKDGGRRGARRWALATNGGVLRLMRRGTLVAKAVSPLPPSRCNYLHLHSVCVPFRQRPAGKRTSLTHLPRSTWRALGPCRSPACPPHTGSFVGTDISAMGFWLGTLVFAIFEALGFGLVHFSAKPKPTKL